MVSTTFRTVCKVLCEAFLLTCLFEMTSFRGARFRVLQSWLCFNASSMLRYLRLTFSFIPHHIAPPQKKKVIVVPTKRGRFYVAGEPHSDCRTGEIQSNNRKRGSIHQASAFLRPRFFITPGVTPEALNTATFSSS